MPSRARRRKSRKRKPSSRKKSSGKKSRRCVSENALSSDEDYVLESNGEESSFDSDESIAQEEEEEKEEEEEEEEEDGDDEEESISIDARNEARSTRRGACRSHRRRRRHEPNSSDEEFNVDLEQDSNGSLSAGGSGSAGGAHSNPRFVPARGRNPVSGKDFAEKNGVEGHASRPVRVRQKHHRRRKHDSSDEDFEMTIENGLDNDGWANGGAFATRPVTRAMEAGHASDYCTEGLISYSVQLEGRKLQENSDHLPKANLKTGEPSLARAVSTIEKSTAAGTRKGKEKVLEGEELTGSPFTAKIAVSTTEDGVTAAVVCGICLSETTVIERGKLDCCDHFFCFGCIMEWAKVESRCPMCKQRFATVAKAGSGVSKRTRTVRVPLRDQVYVPPEDDLPFEDPYADVVCMECHGTGDEWLLLLCDRCDSAAHTFCVGLGRSVPRGDWYCRDCQALIGENSSSENEAEELVLDSDSEEEDEEFLIRSIVASESQPSRQRRVQRVPVPTSGPPSRPRRRSQAGERRRIGHRLVVRRRRSRHVATAPQLSQSAREFLSRVTTELNPVSRVSEAPQSGSARTVPQQRRLQERVIAMRNNWGRIQSGDVQFDAIRTQAAESVQLTMPSSRMAMPTSGTSLAVKNPVDVNSAETSSQGDKDLERAWQMLGQARNLSGGTYSSGMHQQRSVFSHHTPTLPSVQRSLHPTASTVVRATGNIDRPTHVASSRPSESSDAGMKRGVKQQQEVPSGNGKGLALSPVLTNKNREERRRDHPCSSSSTAPISTHMDSCRTSQLTGGKIADASVKICNDRDETTINKNIKCHLVNLGSYNLGGTHNPEGNGTDKEGVCGDKESNGAKSSFLPPQDGLKIHLTELVKKQTWPVYIAERLDKEQFKRIARAAVHSLLALCDPRIKSESLSCFHLEDRGKNPLVNCCTKCLDHHVENAVRTAKDKIVPR